VTIKVINEIVCIEVDGKEVSLSEDAPTVLIKSHWNRDEFFVLQFPAGESWTFNKRDFENAMNNATRWR
jgi:hypothetical protein